jgi:hypothetical protein
MSFISETIIEKVAAELDTSSATYEDLIEEFQREQPVILAYLFSEDFGVLTDEEKPYLLYLTLVIWQSIKQVSSPPVITDNALTEIEEKNWELLQSSSARNFRDRLDVFFKDYSQEDLLAFVEDSLTIEEDDFLTKEGREPMVVALKTIIDLLA